MAERAALIRGYRGYRLLMDQGGTEVGAVNAAAKPFNEWYKAAAYDPDAPDVPRLAFEGFPFEEHTVPPDHWLHAFGRDPLHNADGNFRASGDPFDNPDPAVIATTPAGYYDGSDDAGEFTTNPNDNRYGIFDMSGNVWEILTDQVTTTDSTTPDRAIAGGSYRSNNRQVSCANRGDIGPGSTRPVVGFRVARVSTNPCSPGDWNLDGVIDVQDFFAFVSCFGGAQGAIERGCACFDSDTDGDVDWSDFGTFQTVVTPVSR